jgi:hypothetical protein
MHEENGTWERRRLCWRVEITRDLAGRDAGAHLDTTTGAPVSDPARWRGTLDRAGSETGAPVAVMRRAGYAGAPRN